MRSKFKLQPPEKPYYLMEVEAGKKYFLCKCGKSLDQPFCDGSHKGTGISPLMFEAKETKDVFFCHCKKSKKPPHCDGSHKF